MNGKRAASFIGLIFWLSVAQSGADLIAHWPLDVDGSDSTGNGHDGLVVNGSVFFENAGAIGVTGRAASFPDNGRIDVPFSAELNPESFTVALWAKASSTTGFASPVTSRNDVNGGVSTHGFIIYNDNAGNWNFWTGDGNPGWDTLSGGQVVVDEWTHLAITYDSESETKTIWVNGIESGSDSAPNQYSPNGSVEFKDLHIGAGQDDGANFYFSGDIDDVGLWDEPLGEEEIQDLIQSGVGSFLVDPRINVPSTVTIELPPSQSFAIEISNRGETRQLIVDSVDVIGPDSSNFTITGVPGPIDSGSDGQIEIGFDALGRTGHFEAQLEINSNDPNREFLVIDLLVTVHDPKLAVASQFDFGSFAAGIGVQAASLPVKNDGLSQKLMISDASVSGTDAANFTVLAFPPSLSEAGGTGSVDLSFDPKGGAGRFSAQLEIVSDDALNETTVVILSAEVEISDPLVAWWPLDVDASDGSGNGFDGIAGGAITFGEAGANDLTGTAALFDGSAHIDVPWHPQLNTEDFSVTMWVNPSAAGGSYRSPITNRDDVAPGGAFRHGWIIYNDPNGQWSFWNGGGRGSDGGWNGMNVGPVDVNQWRHLAITYDSVTNTKAFYVDGSEVGSSSPSSYSPNNSEADDDFTHEDEDLHIGGGGDLGTAYMWAGLIDDVGLFRTALNPEEIGSIMNGGVSGIINTSPFAITKVVRSSDTQLEVTWNSRSGITYAVDRAIGGLDVNDWEELDDSALAVGDKTTFTDNDVPTEARAVFYRVRVPE